MKVLVTSGGTIIKLDSVRHIGNMSNGTLGSKIARDALYGGNEVIFFKAEKSKSPMSMTIDFAAKSSSDTWDAFKDVENMWKHYGHRYTEITYKTFDDYQTKLPQIIALYKPDVIILAAAVSDYAPETVVKGKIRTKNDLNIPLKPLPKVISNVREWAGDKTFIVGFKLLVDVPENELIAAARESLGKNRLNVVCANDLRTILNGNHTIYLVLPNNDKYSVSADFLWSEVSAVRANWKG